MLSGPGTAARAAATPIKTSIVSKGIILMPYYRSSGTGTITGLLSGIVPHKLASPRGNDTQGNPNWKVRIEGEVRLAG